MTSSRIPPLVFDAATAAFREAHGVSAALAAERLAAMPVEVHALSAAAGEAIASALRGAGVRLAGNAGVRLAGGAGLHVVAADDYLDEGLADFNRSALEEGLRWTIFRPGELSAWVGPVFEADGPCWACLAHRLRLNRAADVSLRKRSPEEDAAPEVTQEVPASLQAGASLAALAIARFIVDEELHPLKDLLTLDVLRPGAEAHPVLKRPQCPECGLTALGTARARGPVILQSRPKRFTGDGGHGAATPEEIGARLARQVSPLTGIVPSMGPVPERDKAAQGRVSALCEAIERHCMGFQGDEPRQRARWADFGGDAISPDDLQNFSEAQLRRRDATNAVTSLAADRSPFVPVPFDPSAFIDWTPVWSIARSRRCWVPTSYCYSHMRVPAAEQVCCASSNGHAAGISLEEAVLQGFLELVGRDAAAIWWYNRLRRPGVDLASFGEPSFTELEAHCRALGHRVRVLDITTDLGIPAFAALASPEEAENGGRGSRGGGTRRWHMGFGCHVEARLGVRGALTELYQLFDPSPDAPSPWEPRELDSTSFLSPDGSSPARCAADFPSARRDDLRDDVMDCVAAAERANLETLVLDQSRPDIDLYVVKVIVPGLRHFSPRYGPGRLYDVPVKMGLRERPLAESELNLSALEL